MKRFKVALILALVVLHLTGCAGLVVVADDKRSLGEIADDATITSSINVKYLSDDLVSALDVNVDTYRGVVTLNGLDIKAASAHTDDPTSHSNPTPSARISVLPFSTATPHTR